MGVNTPPSANGRRIALGLIGLVVGLVTIVVGINALSTSDAPPPEAPLVQTGSLPPGTTRGSAGSASGPSSAPASVAGGPTTIP